MKEYRYDKEQDAYVPNDEGYSPNDRLISILAWVMMFFDWTLIPLIVTLIAMSYYKTRSGYLYETFRQTLNFQISLLIYGIVGAIVSFILMISVIGIPLIPVVAFGLIAFQVVIPILGIIQAANLKVYRPHFTIPLV